MKHLRSFTTMMALCMITSLMTPSTASAENQQGKTEQQATISQQGITPLTAEQAANDSTKSTNKVLQIPYIETFSPTEIGIISMLPEEQRFRAFEKLLTTHDRIIKEDMRIKHKQQMGNQNGKVLNSFVPNKLGGAIFFTLIVFIIFGTLPIAVIIIICVWQRNKTLRRKQREDVLVQLAQAGQTITPEIIRSLGINEAPYVHNTYITKNEIAGSRTSHKPEHNDNNINSDSPKSAKEQAKEKSSAREYIAYNTAKKQTIDYCIKKGSTGLILCIISVIINRFYPLNLVALIASCIFFVQAASQYLKYYYNKDSYVEEHEISQEPTPSSPENKETPAPNA